MARCNGPYATSDGSSVSMICGLMGWVRQRIKVLGITLVDSPGGIRKGPLVILSYLMQAFCKKGKVTIMIQGGTSGVGGHVKKFLDGFTTLSSGIAFTAAWSNVNLMG